MITMISLVSICLHTKLLHYSLCYILHPYGLFMTGSLFLLIPFTYFTPQSSSPLATTCLSSVSMSLFLFCFICFIFLDYVSEIIQHLPFSVWLISLSTVLSRATHVVTNGKISSFLWLSHIPLYIYLIFIYSSTDGH